MSILHFCNTFFEYELEGKIPLSLEEACKKNSLFLQLQFLPLLYAQKNEGILVTDLPKESFSHSFFLMTGPFPSIKKIETWGSSQLVGRWAREKGIEYAMPPWEVVKKVNSKSYSFAKSPLPGGQLLFPGDQVEGRKILKSCFGTAGRGMIFSDHPKSLAFCQEQWNVGLPVIAEPWVERSLDFSTQWEISQSGAIAFLGTTLCKTTSTGMHQSNTAGMKHLPSFVEEQKAVAREVLKEMAGWGYFGNVGFDAMLYGKNQLQPIVEINARKTMGWVTLMYQKKNYPDREIELTFVASKQKGLLPIELGAVKFSRQVVIHLR